MARVSVSAEPVLIGVPFPALAQLARSTPHSAAATTSALFMAWRSSWAKFPSEVVYHAGGDTTVTFRETKRYWLGAAPLRIVVGARPASFRGRRPGGGPTSADGEVSDREPPDR